MKPITPSKPTRYDSADYRKNEEHNAGCLELAIAVGSEFGVVAHCFQYFMRLRAIGGETPRGTCRSTGGKHD